MAKNDYRQQAEAQYDPSYNARVQAMKNQLAQNQLALDQSKTGINQNYDTQIGNQNRNNMINKNNISNTMLGRGLGNSSIVTSGLAESDSRNTRLVDTINTARTGALNDIEAQKAMLTQNMNNTLGQMAGDREKELMALANQLEDRDWEKTFKDNQFNWQKEQDLFEQAFKDKQFNFSKEQSLFENAFKDKQFNWQKEQGAFDNAFRDKQFGWQKQQDIANQGFREKELSMRQQQMQMEQAYKNSMLALEKQKYAMQKNGGLDPDRVRGELQAIMYDPSRTPQEKYAIARAMKTTYGNKTGFGEFNKEVDASINAIGRTLNVGNNVKKSFNNFWNKTKSGVGSGNNTKTSSNSSNKTGGFIQGTKRYY